ncbi:MAG TPA: hypothetical protein VKR06_09665 [Ktedonosporobacter sp.]|nr:hypothetical protein [Ktedonosporobacter sp.]
MRAKRNIPTDLFEYPGMRQQSVATRIILVGLILNADDAGRGLAHAGWLARAFNESIAQIEEALMALEKIDLLTCYQGGRHRYYALTHWRKWQRLRRPLPSRHPAPPALGQQQKEEVSYGSQS